MSAKKRFRVRVWHGSNTACYDDKVRRCIIRLEAGR